MLLENGKQDKRTFRKKKRRKSIRYTFRCTRLAFLLFSIVSSRKGRFSLNTAIRIDRVNENKQDTENVRISLQELCSFFEFQSVWSMDPRASDRKLCVSLSSAPEVTARRHTDHATICRFADCIFFRAPGKLPACLFFARSAIVEGLVTISLDRDENLRLSPLELWNVYKADNKRRLLSLFLESLTIFSYLSFLQIFDSPK